MLFAGTLNPEQCDVDEYYQAVPDGNGNLRLTALIEHDAAPYEQFTTSKLPEVAADNPQEWSRRLSRISSPF